MSEGDATRKEGSGASGGVTATLGPRQGGDGRARGEEGTDRTEPATKERPRVGRYVVGERLGRGGMGDVYRAHDPLLDRPVALKVLRRSSSDPSLRARPRVIREARAAAALTHPNAVTVFDVGEDDGDAFIAMELLEGEDLRSVLRRGGGTREQRLRWLLEAARALEAAHQRGLVHRDVKPENMFLTTGGVLKILDFGIAKREGAGEAHVTSREDLGPSSLRTVEGRRIGTPRYMAPEQQAGHATDARTDEYAWGLVAIELLCDATLPEMKSTAPLSEPAGADDRRAEIARHLEAGAPGLPDGVRSAIVRALEPDKSARFPSMSPIVRALERELGMESAPSVEASGPDTTQPGNGADAQTTVLEDSEPLREPDAAQPPAVSPAPPRARRVLEPLIAFSVVIGVSAAVMQRDAIARRFAGGRSDTSVAASGGRPAARAASLRAEPASTRETSPNDRYTFLGDGTYVFAKNVETGLRLEWEGPAGGRPPFPPRVFGSASPADEVFLRPIRHRGADGIAIHSRGRPPDEPTSVVRFVTPALQASRVLRGMISGVAMVGGTEALYLLATRLVEYERRVGGNVVERAPPGAELQLQLEGEAAREKPTAWARPLSLDEVAAWGPSLANGGQRLGASYTTADGIRFALLEKDGVASGAVRTLSSYKGLSAVGFAGDVAVVAWIEEPGPTARLMLAQVSPAAAAGAPASAGRGGFDRAPALAALDERSVAVAWAVPLERGGFVVRALRVHASGEVEAPIDVSAVSQTPIDRLEIVTVASGAVLVSWLESPTILKSARVTIAP